ncbi:MAG TPA: RagB/SusD family nutrient uptake outer membrane protein [Cyclobacteriaceae bacterium]
MKISNIKSRGIIFSLVLSLSACTELEHRNYSTIVASDFSPSESDIAAIISSGYVAWRQTLLEWNGIWRTQEVTGDEIVIPGRPNGWVDGGIYKRIHQHKWTADDDNVVQGWGRTYAGITTCNKVIYQIESNTVPLTDEKKASVLAELKTLRASYYYLLLDIYGKVPIVTDFNVPDGFLPEQSSREDVYNFVVSEITTNIDNLSEDNTPATYGRFNKWAAYTLLAKVYLNAEVYTGTEQWAKCIEACDQVINSNKGYALEADQKNVFITENQNSKEIIFGLAIDDKYTTHWNAFDIHMQTLQPSLQGKYKLKYSPWGGMCAIPQFISTFDADDSRLTKNYIYGQQYLSTGEEIKCTMGAYTGQPLAFINEIPSVDASEEIHGYRFGKFEIAAGSSNILNNDFPVFRYADVLMMKAESLLRTNKADDAAVIVTQVRQRAFTANPAKATVTGADLQTGSVYDYGLRDTNNQTTEGGADIQYGRFLDELAWEFNQEGHRRQDMIRFGVFDTKSWFSHSPNGSYRKVYPIPQSEINKNPKLQQNDGY